MGFYGGWGDWMRVLTCEPGLCGLNTLHASMPKEEAPGLGQTPGEGEEGAA